MQAVFFGRALERGAEDSLFGAPAPGLGAEPSSCLTEKAVFGPRLPALSSPGSLLGWRFTIEEVDLPGTGRLSVYWRPCFHIRRA